MEESRDPAIKLFGKTIPLRPVEKAPTPSVESEKDRSSNRDATNFETQDRGPPNSEDRGTAQEQSGEHDKLMKNSEPDEQEADASKSQEETPKRPDKILPCPRCSSLDTKFCYFNNYNANQPRHFCKNCQRYWTAGGTMRNVPVGAGRRKNKNTASHFRSIAVSDAIFQTVRQDDQDAIHHHPLKPNGTVLSFGSDAPLPCPMATNNGIGSVPHRIEEQVDLNPIVENGDEHSSGSSMTASSSIEDRIRVNSQQLPIESHQAFDPRIPYFNGSPWPYQWAPAPFCSRNFAIPFYPATTYWGCTPAGAWSIPWLSPPLASFHTCDSSESGPISPTLGKHSRDGDVIEQINSENGDTFDQNKQERRLWIPKTLRIDDPEAAAKSSIWNTIGFKDTDNGGGIFKSFHKKDNVKNHMAEASQVLHANPAALSRSLNFQESA